MSKLIPITTPLREFKGHENWVTAIAVFPDQRQMVTASRDKTLRLWDEPIQAHSYWINSLDFSPDGKVLASGSGDQTMKLWNTKTWQQQGDPIECGYGVNCVQYSPSGELLAIATDSNIQIYNSCTREHVATEGHKTLNYALAWTPDGTRLITCVYDSDPIIREWDTSTSTWKQVGDPWMGHSEVIYAIALNPAGTLVASASDDSHVRLWQLSDQRTVATFKHLSAVTCVTFSLDGKHILSGDEDYILSEWAVPNVINSKAYFGQILAVTTVRTACIDGDLSTAQELLTKDINTDPNNHTSYSHRSFVMARTQDWDHALQDAIDSINIKPSLTGYISKGIALYGKGHISDARAAFDVASLYIDQDSQTTHFLLLIEAIALFNADQHDEANLLLLKELTTGSPSADTRACHVVQAYLRVQLGIKAFDSKRYDEAAEHFTAAVNCNDLSSKSDIHHIYEDLVVLFGWNLKSLWLTAHQKQCDAFLRAGRLQDAMKSYRYMMDMSDDVTKANCFDWSNAFMEECGAPFLTNGDAANNYDRTINLNLNCF